MGINRYYKRTPYEGELYQPNVELISSVLQQAQTKYDTNFAMSEKLKNRYVNALAPDRAAADEIQQGTEKRIDDIVTKYSGDYSAASKDLYKLVSDIEKEYNPGGKAHAIETNYKNYNDALTTERERLKKGEVISSQLEALQGYVGRSYTGIGEKDKVSGSYNMLSTPDLAKYVDESKLIDEAYTKTPEQKRKEGRSYFKNGNQYYQEIETQGKPYDVLSQAFSNALFGDNAYTTYKDQFNFLTGNQQSPAEFEQGIIDSANAHASTRAYMNTSDILKAERDPVYMENLRHGNRMNEAKYKQKLKDTSDKAMMDSLFGGVEIGENVNRMAGAELPKDWRTYSTGKQTLKYPGSMSGATYIENETLSTKDNLYDLLSTNKIKEVAPGVNGNLLQAGAKRLAQEQGFKFDEQSDAWKRNFFANNETEIRDKYNTDIKNVQVGIADEFPINSEKASTALKNKLIPSAMSGGNSVFQIQNGQLSEFTKLGDIGVKEDDVYDSNGAIKKGVKVTDYVVPGQFYTKPAYKVVLPNGKSFFVTDQNKDRFEHFSNIANAHAPILENGSEYGNSFQVQLGQNSLNVRPKMSYDYNENGQVSANMQYYHVAPDGKMEVILNASGNGPATTYDIWNLDKERIKSAFPLGAAKSDFSRFIMDSHGVDFNDDEE